MPWREARFLAGDLELAGRTSDPRTTLGVTHPAAGVGDLRTHWGSSLPPKVTLQNEMTGPLTFWTEKCLSLALTGKTNQPYHP